MPIVIDLDVSNKKTDKSLDKLQKALETLDAVQQRLNATLSQTAATANQAANAFGKMATNGRRAQSASPTQGQRRVSAYYSAIAGSNPQAALNYANSRLAADPYDAQAIRLKNRAQNALKRNQNNGLATALARTRWAQTASGMVGMPLGVDLAKYGSLLLGSGAMSGAAGGAGAAGGGAAVAAMLNPVTAAILACVAALGIFAVALKSSASSIAGIAKMSAVSGNPSTIQKLTPFAGALGTDVGSLAGRLQANIGNGGIGAGFAMQAGINPIGGPFGDNDYAGKLQQAMRHIAGMRSFSDARRYAEGIGVPELANLQRLSPGNKAYLASNQSVGVDQRSLEAAVNFEFTISRIAQSFEQIKNSLVAPALNGAAMLLEHVADWIGNIAAKIREFFENILHKLGIKTAAQENNVKALNENTRALKDFREIIGGGPRAQGSVPSKVNGLAPNQNFASVRLGAI